MAVSYHETLIDLIIISVDRGKGLIIQPEQWWSPYSRDLQHYSRRGFGIPRLQLASAFPAKRIGTRAVGNTSERETTKTTNAPGSADNLAAQQTQTEELTATALDGKMRLKKIEKVRGKSRRNKPWG